MIDVKFFIDNFIKNQFKKTLEEYKKDISIYKLPNQLISPEWLIHYRIIRKIVTPKRISGYIKYLEQLGLNKNIASNTRIIVVDRLMSGSGIRFFCSILLFAIGIEKIKNLFLINIQKENSPENNLFRFSKCLYKDDILQFLGDLSIPFNITQKFDDTVSWESEFNYFPPYYWDIKKFKKDKLNDQSSKIIQSINQYIKNQ